MNSESRLAVEFKNVHKWFGDCISTRGLSFQVSTGSIHAIVGENGAGKSTAMKMLYGLYPPNEGEIRVFGEVAQFKSPIDAMAKGIGMVHQHFMLAEPLTALDNILLFQKNTSAFQPMNRAHYRRVFTDLAKQYQFDIDWDRPVQELSVGVQQRIEILKILSQNSQIIILDEPTAVLTPQETEELFKNLRKLKEEGRTILIITHKLKEVMTLADEVTVFRNGQVISSQKISETSPTKLAEAMVGRSLKNLSQAPRNNPDTHNTVLQMDTLITDKKLASLHELKMKVHRREIVGIAGVEGNGQELLIQALLDPHSLKIEGDIQIKAESTMKLSPAEIRRLGLAAFPEDRLRLGILKGRPVFENFILGYHHSAQFSRYGFLDFKSIFMRTEQFMEKFDVRPRDVYKNIDTLSGGNQQKLVVARELQNHPDFILAAKPTRGVDIGAIEFIHEQLLEARERGAGILLISSELEELMTLSDRILVMFKGQFVAEFKRSQGYNEIQLGAAMGGHT